ncbi:MAG: sigma-54-dependent Fis family transcriptional regulator [Planctomycetaceae bacterium]|nr:sigma-54-dependent Fis family transcriptional regulator [Planctomycetaceae bacterium]
MTDQPRTVLIVDDDPAQRDLLGSFVGGLGYAVREAESAEDALRLFAAEPPAMVLLDVRLPGMSGIEALAEIRELQPTLPVCLITAHADLRQAIEAVKSGADDYLAKPIDLDELAAAMADAIGPAESTGAAAVPAAPLPDWFIAVSAPMQRLVDTAAVVADSAAPVLISGESGAGKEGIAQLIHQWSPRRDGPLLTANCGGLPDTLIESELFGHAKGAFTGATQSRQGLFRAADGGTLFLDEIGELPLPLQPALLRALESGQITPVGSDAPVTVDVRLVAASNRNLEAAIADGEFREDLYYRINVVELIVPPLRDRRDDVLPLARRFATEFAGGPTRLSPQAMQCLLAYHWPGNVRELRNAVQRACLLARGDVILPEHMPPKIATHCGNAPAAEEDGNRLSQLERAAILATLEETGGNRTQAAKKLGISRRTLIYKLRVIEGESAERAGESGEPDG